MEHEGLLHVDWSAAFAQLADPAATSGREAQWALALHHAVAQAALRMVDYSTGSSPLRTIALTGGVFMNQILNERLIPALEARGWRVLIHRQTPPNDGCIALGQAVIAGRLSPCA